MAKLTKAGTPRKVRADYDYKLFRVHKPGGQGYTTVSLSWDDYMQLGRKVGHPRKLASLAVKASLNCEPSGDVAWSRLVLAKLKTLVLEGVKQ